MYIYIYILRHQKFIIDCPQGYMTRKQFIAVYKSLCSKDNAERFASHIFRALDLDKSDTIDFREFLIGLSMTSTISSPETKLEWIFQVFDIDGNGILTRNECLEVIDAIARFNQSQIIDQHNSKSEQLVIAAKRSMMKIFDNICDDEHDVLTMAQFVDRCSKDEFISQLLASTPGIGKGSTVTQNAYDVSINNN